MWAGCCGCGSVVQIIGNVLVLALAGGAGGDRAIDRQIDCDTLVADSGMCCLVLGMLLVESGFGDQWRQMSP